jgi:RNA polymerase sigma-70 factor (ECF subfamily)
LYGICRNIARSARRKRRALREAAVEELPDTEAPASQERALWLKQNSARLVEVLDELSEEQRMIFVLYELEEVSMEEIALALEAPQRTCYSRLEAARKQVLARFRRKLFLAETAPIEVFK